MRRLKEAMIYVQGVKFGKKTWSKMWMALLQPQSPGAGWLELYSLPEASSEDELPNPMTPLEEEKSERRVIRLSDCLGITLAPEELCPSGCGAFYLTTTLRTYTLASTVCQEWFQHLYQLAAQDPGEEALEEASHLSMKDNELYSSWNGELFPVTVKSTEASVRCRLTGDFLVSPDVDALFLLDRDMSHTVFHWPYRLLRRFGQVKGGFSIEAGHQCDSGEGMFTFLSEEAQQIFQAIARGCLTEPGTTDSSAQSPKSISDRSDQLSNQPPTSKPSPLTSKPPDITADTNAEPTFHHYATISDSSADGELSPSQPGGERSRQPDSINLKDFGEACLHYNQRQQVHNRMNDQAKPGRDSSRDAAYSLVSYSEPPLKLQPDPRSLAFPHFQSLPLSLPHPPPKPSLRPPAPVSKAIQTQTQDRAGDRPAAQARGEPQRRKVGDPEHPSPPPPSAGVPTSFKQKLSEIISKDLAKLQAPRRPGGADSTPFSYY